VEQEGQGEDTKTDWRCDTAKYTSGKCSHVADCAKGAITLKKECFRFHFFYF